MTPVALKAVERATAAVLLPPPELTVTEWANRYRRLSAEASAEAGQYRSDRAPFQAGIMDAVSDPTCAEIVVMSSAQVGKTTVVENVIGYYISQDPSPMLLIQPTLEMAEGFSKDRLSTMLRDTPVLRGLVQEARTRNSANTLLHKQFVGGHITLAGANSPASLAMRPVRIVACDEVDRYPVSAGTEGDPISLARKRQATFWNRKLLVTSTPTVKGISRIEFAFEASDKRLFHVPCPHCGEFQVLTWESVRWPETQPADAHLICMHCGAVLPESDRVAMIRAGEWRATAPFNGVAGFHISELYSPWRRLAEIVADFHAAKARPELLQVWWNTSLGLPWEDRAGEIVRAEGLAARAEGYAPGTAPEGVLMVTAGVDVQHNRLAVVILGWGEGEECWILWHSEIGGPPSDPKTWAAVDDLLLREIPHEGGASVRVERASVDVSDGVTHQFAMDFCLRRYRRGVLGVKGDAQAAREVIRKPTSLRKPWMLGVDTIKGVLSARLKVPGHVHFPSGLPPRFYEQMTAERLVVEHVKGFPRLRWVKPRHADNEAWDCVVYGYAAAVHAGLKSANWTLRRKRLEAAARRASPNEAAAAPIEQQAPPPPVARRNPFAMPARRGGWVGQW